jgi:LPS export ABC transporter protein LptC
MKFASLKYLIPVTFLAGIFFSCRNDIEEIRAITDDRELPIQTTTNAEFFYTEGGRIKNKLVAAEVNRYVGEDAQYLEVTGGFYMIIYDTLEMEEARLSASRGLYFESENRMEAHYNVELANISGNKLNTEELIWLQDSNKVYTEEDVMITSADGVVFGKGLESETFTRYTIKQISDSKLYIDENNSDESVEN